MDPGRWYVCPECAAEFAVSTVFERSEETIVVCPLCGSVEVEPLKDEWVEFVGLRRNAAT